MRSKHWQDTWWERQPLVNDVIEGKQDIYSLILTSQNGLWPLIQFFLAKANRHSWKEKKKKKKTGGLHSTLSLNHNKPKISQDINLFPKKMSFLYASQHLFSTILLSLCLSLSWFISWAPPSSWNSQGLGLRRCLKYRLQPVILKWETVPLPQRISGNVWRYLFHFVSLTVTAGNSTGMH